jgi:hypothetical protein
LGKLEENWTPIDFVIKLGEGERKERIGHPLNEKKRGHPLSMLFSRSESRIGREKGTGIEGIHGIRIEH